MGRKDRVATQIALQLQDLFIAADKGAKDPQLSLPAPKVEGPRTRSGLHLPPALCTAA